jgi:3-hydroxyisobutyrate dehydrogenase-like beta-hydroxyacid dehydrogenase
MRVGLVGTGRMGTAMGERIVAAGFPLTVHNRTRERAAALLSAGADWADRPAELAAGCDVVLTVLTDDRAVESVYCGPDGLLEDGDGVVFVECSTVRTATVARLHERVRHGGGRLVDAPLAGPPAAARAGRLMVMAGGDAADLATVTPVLDTYSRRTVHMGPVGSGTTMKLVLMSPMGAFFAALAEGLAIGSQAGLDRARMLEVILDSHTAPPVLHDRAALLRGETSVEEPPGFDVQGVRKDLRAIVATGQDFGVPTSVVSAALGTFSAGTAGGYAERDLIFIVDFVRAVAEAGG